jgi:tetratricopeptide (TPR) repeat protein
MSLTPHHPTARILVMGMTCIVAFGGCRWSSIGQNTLGVRLYEQGRYSEALQQFQTAQRTDPSNPDGYYNLASTYHKLGVTQKDAQVIEQAESLYNQCLDLQPNHVDCHRGLAVLLAESGRPDSAMKLLKNWATANPQMSDPRIELARLHQEFGQTKVAEQYLDEALALNPNDHRAWTARGQMREEAGELDQALQNYQQSLAINSLQPDIYQRVAGVNVKIAQRTMNGIGQPQGGWTVNNPQPNAGNRY